MADTRAARAAAPARLPARVLASRAPTCARTCSSRATGRRSRRTAARRPTGTCASASASPRARSGRMREPRAGSPDLRGYFSLDFHSMDAWYEEEERIYVHARDPYLRADARRSSRHVVVEVGGVEVAETRRPVLLDETGPDHALLRPARRRPARAARARARRSPSARTRAAATTGRCAAADGRSARDAAWRYAQPLPDVGADRRAPLLLAGARGHGAAHRRRGPAAPARRARRRRRRGAAAVARPPRDAAAGEHARRARRAAAARLARARTTAPRARPTASWTWPTSAPAAPPAVALLAGRRPCFSRGARRAESRLCVHAFLHPRRERRVASASSTSRASCT